MGKRWLIALAALLIAPVAHAQEQTPTAPRHTWSFEGPFGKYDRGAVQRGFLVYQQVCSSCHSLNYLSYRNLGETGGPYELFRVMNQETGAIEEELFPHGGEGRRVPPAENKYVRGIAAAVMVRGVDRDTGEAIERPATASDRFRAPYANEQAARAANGGALPPDLSVITSARAGGADYVRALLTGYTGEEREGRYVNRYFPGELISMPPPLSADGMVTYSDGTNATRAQMAEDVVHFLQWAADPHMEARNRTGFVTMVFLIIFATLMYLSYKQVWRGTKH
jgi:cytochrome c1